MRMRWMTDLSHKAKEKTWSWSSTPRSVLLWWTRHLFSLVASQRLHYASRSGLEGIATHISCFGARLRVSNWFQVTCPRRHGGSYRCAPDWPHSYAPPTPFYQPLARTSWSFQSMVWRLRASNSFETDRSAFLHIVHENTSFLESMETILLVDLSKSFAVSIPKAISSA